MPRVFVSFVHEDQKIAESVQALLADELSLGKEVFLSADQSLVLGGDIWLDKIRAALEGCEVLVLLLSARSLRRAWVSFEAGAVWLARKPVIPVCIGRMSKGALPHPYSSMQALDLPADAYYLVKSVHQHLKMDSPPPAPPMIKRLGRALNSEKDESKGIWGRMADAIDYYEFLESAISNWQDEPERRRLPPEV
jgi:hypothetical protein